MEDELKKGILENIFTRPESYAIFGYSFVTGQIWVYFLIYHRDESKGKKYLKKFYSKVAIGLLWYSFVLVPNYLIRHGFNDFNPEDVFALTTETILYGFFLQTIIFIFIFKVIKRL